MGEGTIIGVDLGGTKVRVGAVAGGRVARAVSRPISGQAAEQVVLEEIASAIAELHDEQVVGIGCGVPSVVDVATGTVFEVENIPSWKRVPLKAVLERRFSVPTYVNNDANAFAVGEHVFGKGRAYRDLVGLTLGTGLGTGVIIGGLLHSGRNCCAGEIGAMPHKGLTLEDWCAGRFFLREGGVSGGEAHERARSGDAAAIALFERFGRELAEAVMIVCCAYDPEAVILGGSIAAAFDLFEAPMRAGLAAFAYPHVIERLVIEASELADAAVLGAAALYVDAMTAGGGTGATA
ncbi:MAG TPA: ROK family protein [Thermoanaerobaculales bacterium]|nr:ROK family protein [Thermoanaerobaculales bacterium]HQL31459.1 ROK family protein [Thermoanaerobaculales bacterium]